MSPVMKNIAIILGVLTLAFFGYYLYSQNKNNSLQTDSSSTSLEEMLSTTGVFIERTALLNEVKLDTKVFSDPLFASYKSFTRPLNPEAFGRNNPFAESFSSSGGGF